MSRASICKAAFLSKPHASNSSGAAQGLFQRWPDRKGEGRPPDTSTQPGTPETTPVSPELGTLSDARAGE